MNDLSKARARWLEVGEESEAQRIDNFLLRELKGVPGEWHLFAVESEPVADSLAADVEKLYEEVEVGSPVFIA